MSAPPHDFSLSLQILVRKSAHSRARNRTPPPWRPPSLPCSRCPVPAAATTSLIPAHPAPFSAKPFHQVRLPHLPAVAPCTASLSFVSSVFCSPLSQSFQPMLWVHLRRVVLCSWCVWHRWVHVELTWFDFRCWKLESFKKMQCLHLYFIFAFVCPSEGVCGERSWRFNHQSGRNWKKKKNKTLMQETVCQSHRARIFLTASLQCVFIFTFGIVRMDLSNSCYLQSTCV